MKNLVLFLSGLFASTLVLAACGSQDGKPSTTIVHNYYGNTATTTSTTTEPSTTTDTTTITRTETNTDSTSTTTNTGTTGAGGVGEGGQGQGGMGGSDPGGNVGGAGQGTGGMSGMGGQGGAGGQPQPTCDATQFFVDTPDVKEHRVELRASSNSYALFYHPVNAGPWTTQMFGKSGLPTRAPFGLPGANGWIRTTSGSANGFGFSGWSDVGGKSTLLRLNGDGDILSSTPAAWLTYDVYAGATSDLVGWTDFTPNGEQSLFFFKIAKFTDQGKMQDVVESQTVVAGYAEFRGLAAIGNTVAFSVYTITNDPSYKLGARRTLDVVVQTGKNMATVLPFAQNDVDDVEHIEGNHVFTDGNAFYVHTTLRDNYGGPAHQYLSTVMPNGVRGPVYELGAPVAPESVIKTDTGYMGASYDSFSGMYRVVWFTPEGDVTATQELFQFVPDSDSGNRLMLAKIDADHYAIAANILNGGIPAVAFIAVTCQ